MTRRLLAGYLTVTAFVLLALEIPLGVVLARLERNSLVADVRHDADIVAVYASEPLAGGDPGPIDVGPIEEVARQYAARSEGRLVVVDGRGELVADSAPVDGAGARTFATRPEIADALAGRETSGFRSSDTLGGDIFFVALPVNVGGRVVGAVRITYPSSFVESRVLRSWLLLAATGAGVLAVVALMSRSLARGVTAPLHRLEAVAHRLGDGDLAARVDDADTEHGVPEVRVLARVLNETAAKLDRLLASQREFVADASHQLRTPLAALRLRLEVAEVGVSGEAAGDIHAALAEVYRLTRLVDGLLALARADAGASVREAVGVAAVVDDRRQAWAPLAEEHGVRLVTHVPRRLYALATPGHLEQALDNLISNAVDASPPGGTVTVGVRGSHGDRGDAVHLHVVDEGPGMDDTARAMAFERFWSGDDSTKRVGGTGIGLSIVAKLVRADGGDVSLERAPGGGLDAHLVLERATAPSRHPARARSSSLAVPSRK